MSDDAKPQGTVQIALRISPDLRERVKAAADANNRSVNSELTSTLEEKYPAPVDPLVHDAIKKALEFLESLPRDKRDKFIEQLPKKFQDEDPDLPASTVSVLLDIFQRLKKTADKLDRFHLTPTDD